MLYGALVGTPKQAAVFQQVDQALSRTVEKVIVRDIITLAAAAVGTTIQVEQNVGWDTVLDPFGMELEVTGLGAGSLISFGDLNYPTALDNGVAVSAAGKIKLGSAIAAANYFQPLWQLLGFASLAAALAVSKQATLIFTISGAAATGTLAWSIKGDARE